MDFKFDKTQQKVLCIVSAVFTLLPVLAILLADYLVNRMPMVVIITIMTLPPIAIGTWIKYAESLLYFKELRRHGIEPPIHKNDAAEVAMILQNAEKLQPMEDAEAQEATDKKSFVFSIVSFGCSILFAGWMLWNRSYFLSMGMSDWLPFFYGAGAIAVGGWIVSGMKYHKQRDNALYKNEGDPDPRKKSRPGLIHSVVMILFLMFVSYIYGYFLDQAGKFVYYNKLQKLYGEYYGEHKGERVDITKNQAMRSDWEKYIGVYPAYDQGGTVYEYKREGEGQYPFLHFRSVYDVDWEGTRAMTGYCETLQRAGWEESSKLLYTHTIGNMTYVIDLREWDQNGKNQVVIDCYSYDNEGHGILP